jgi:hypothetical protein
MKDIFLNFAHICENAFLAEDKKLNIIGDFDTINFARKKEDKEKPLSLQFFLVFNFSGPQGEYETSVQIIDSSDKVILPEKKITQKLENKKVGFIGKYNILFPQPGTYFVEIRVNENILKTLELNLRERIQS